MYHADSHGARPQPSIICGLNLARRCALPPYPRPSSPRPDAAGACCVSCPLGAGAGALSARSVSPLRRRICDSSPDGAAGDGAAGATGATCKLPPSAFAKAAFANSFEKTTAPLSQKRGLSRIVCGLRGLRLAHKRCKAGGAKPAPAASAVRCGATGLRGSVVCPRPLRSTPSCA